MNERIKELCLKSGAYEHYEVNEGVNGDELPMQKFAELIVQECIYIVQIKMPRNGSTPENLRSREHVRDIREHFGVE